MNIKKGDMVSIKQDFIDRNNRYEYDSRDIWEVKEVYKMGGGYHVAVINNLTGYGSAHLCTYNKIWDDWLQLTQYFPNKDIEYYEAAYVRYNAYDSPTEVYSGFGETEVESRAMLLFDLLEKKILTPDGLNLKEVDRRKEYENEFE